MADREVDLERLRRPTAHGSRSDTKITKDTKLTKLTKNALAGPSEGEHYTAMRLKPAGISTSTLKLKMNPRRSPVVLRYEVT